METKNANLDFRYKEGIEERGQRVETMRPLETSESRQIRGKGEVARNEERKGWLKFPKKNVLYFSEASTFRL